VQWDPTFSIRINREHEANSRLSQFCENRKPLKVKGIFIFTSLIYLKERNLYINRITCCFKHRYLKYRRMHIFVIRQVWSRRKQVGCRFPWFVEGEHTNLYKEILKFRRVTDTQISFTVCHWRISSAQWSVSYILRKLLKILEYTYKKLSTAINLQEDWRKPEEINDRYLRLRLS
jgi:hypothetical protein